MNIGVDAELEHKSPLPSLRFCCLWVCSTCIRSIHSAASSA